MKTIDIANLIANAITEEIIIDRKERKYNIDGVEISFKFTSKTKKPFRAENSDKLYNGQYGMLYIYHCDPEYVIDVAFEFAEKVRKEIGYDIAFPCSNYHGCFGYKFQIIFGKEIKE